MPTIKTTAAVRNVLPETLKGVLVKRDDDTIWLDYKNADLNALVNAASTLTNLKWPVGWDASNLINAVTRAEKAAAKASARAAATTRGELDPDIEVAMKKLLKRHNIGPRAILATYEFLGVVIEKKDAEWVIRVDGHEATITAELDHSGRKYSPRDYDLAGIELPFIYQESAKARAIREAPYKAVRLAIRVRIAKALGLDELPEEAEKARAWRVENGFEAPPRPKERKHGDWTCAFCWRVHAVDSNGRLVHHGYQRPGHGSIVGDCNGVGELPWERSPEGAKWALEGNLLRSERLTDRLIGAGYFRLHVDERNATGKVETVWIFPDDPRWAEAETIAKHKDERFLQALWSGWFCSIPWLRAAIREWKYEKIGAVGAPMPTILPEDSADRQRARGGS